MSKLQAEINKLKLENDRLQKENQEIKKNQKSQEQSQQSQQNQQKKEFEILDENDIDNLEKIEEIGSGGGGRVYKVSKKEIYALKEMNTNESNIKDLKHFIGEYEIMSMLQHPNILKAIGIFLSSKKLPPSILLEYIPMNLSTAITSRKFSKEQTVFCIYQIVEGMKFIHFNKIIHRDLKPTNILVSKDGTIKICDFGISKLMTLEQQTMTLGVGTQKFMAPEIINEEDDYDEKVDVYSFGVVIYFILSGGEVPKIKVKDVLNGKKADIPSTFTKFSKELINECWNYESKDRPSFDNILEKMERNDYKFIELTKSELQNVKKLINQHKSKIQSYNK